MIYVTVDSSAEREDWHLQILNRIVKGIKGLEKDGFKIERYDQFPESGPISKRLLTISRAGNGVDSQRP